jgi:hypothetical protein
MKAVFLLLVAAGAAACAGAAHAQSKPGKDGVDRRVVVVNERASDMVRLYASRTTTSSWEENILTRPIVAGSSVVVNFDDGSGACNFDFRAVFRDRQSVLMWNINVCTESYWRVMD